MFTEVTSYDYVTYWSLYHLKMVSKGLVTLKCVGVIICRLKDFYASHWLTEKKEGKSSYMEASKIFQMTSDGTVHFSVTKP